MRQGTATAMMALVSGGLCVCAHSAPPGKVDFNADVKPILSDRCFNCHGPDAAKREGDLRLDLKAGVLGADGSGVITPGDPESSELYRRIASSDEDERMPPADSKLALTKDEIALIGRWIEQGAEWQEHWSFVPPISPPVPSVADAAWPKNKIDRFVLSRLEREGLRPAVEASREKLIRRLGFDLNGLPPTLEEIDAFVADRSPDAYEKVVDRLLASSRYGERMAASWLDVARYSDTYGYQVDRDRFVWPWRDWVIRAFNDNQPYDRFVTDQLAGDLQPDATDDQVLATTFNRLHPQKVEGGSTPEEFRVEYVADRTQTFATALLGLTLECARCHDHKYDPVTQKEYYQLFAFFNNIDEAGLYSWYTKSIPTPTLLLADDAKKAEIAEVEKHIVAAEAQLASLAESRREAFEAWRKTAAAPLGEAGDSSTARPLELPGRVALLDFENDKKGANRSVPGKVGKAVELTGDDGIGLEVGNFRRCEPFSVTLWMKTPDEKERAVVFHRSKAWTDAGSRGYQLLIENGRLSASLIHFWPGNAIRVRTREKLPTNVWRHVAIVYDGSSRADGLRLYVDGQPADCEVVRDNLTKNITGGGGDNITIGQRSRDRGFAGGLVDEFQVFDRRLSALEVAQLHDGNSLIASLRGAAGSLTKDRSEALYAHYLATADAAYLAQLESLKQARQRRGEVGDGIPEIMAMRERPLTPRQTYVLQRGSYTAPGEPVAPNTPVSLPAFPDGVPKNRLGLARWLTAPNHPLAARVAVNRFWQTSFGRGLAHTPEDFGRQGQAPTHPELLDWLAHDFVAHGWDVKRLLKKMVMSATYRQSSTVSPELLARDPENLLLARAPSYRLPAEMLRDNVLAVSGLLVDRFGGAPVRPYEVEASFKPAKRDKGAGLYRRSVYTYWKRTAPAPVMMTLDASKRDVCRMRRERTSTPLQALVLMNDPQFVEAARALAQRSIRRHDVDDDAVIEDLFRILTGRRPDANERAALRELYDGQFRAFESDIEAAKRYLAIGDAAVDPEISTARLAAVAIVANTLMNFDECVMKR